MESCGDPIDDSSHLGDRELVTIAGVLIRPESTRMSLMYSSSHQVTRLIESRNNLRRAGFATRLLEFQSRVHRNSTASIVHLGLDPRW